MVIFFGKARKNMYQHAVLFLFIQFFIGDGRLIEIVLYKIQGTILFSR
jgi:hypothetical protein